MYFLVECPNENCICLNKLLPVYMGSSGKFDVFHSFKLVRCGSCYKKIPQVNSIMLVACIWGYRGLVHNEKKVTTETDKKAHKIEFFEHKKGVIWDWLVIQLKPLQQQQIFENVNLSDNNKNFTEIIEYLINQFSSTSQASKYQKRYESIGEECKSTVEEEREEKEEKEEVGDNETDQ